MKLSLGQASELKTAVLKHADTLAEDARGNTVNADHAAKANMHKVQSYDLPWCFFIPSRGVAGVIRALLVGSSFVPVIMALWIGGLSGCIKRMAESAECASSEEDTCGHWMHANT